MVGREGLHQHPTAARSAPRASGDLGEQLKGPFRCSEVRDVQADVCVDHPDKGNVRKIEALGDHLRAEQDMDQSLAEGAQHPAVTAALLHRVAVHAAHNITVELFLDFRL